MSKSDSIPLSQAQKLNWGFISTADIGNKNASGIQQSGLGNLYIVSSRTLEKAKQFQQKHKFEHISDSYDSVLNDNKVDILYIPTPTTHREHYVINAIQAKKHILIEKPVASNAQQLRKILDECVTHKTVLLDGVMFVHHPRLYYIRELLSDTHTFGDIRTVHCSFGFPGMQDNEYVKNNIRLDPTLEPLGALGDLSWYTIRMILFVYRYQVPLTVSCSAVYYDRTTQKYTYTVQHSKNELKGVMTELTCLLTFPNGATATFHSSFNSQFRQYVEITGTKQSIRINDFVIPDHEDYATFDIHRQVHDVAKGEEKPVDTIDHTQVTIKHSKQQHVLMVTTLQRLVAEQKQLVHKSKQATKSAKTERPPPPASVERYNSRDVVIESDKDGQLSILMDEEYKLINWANMALITQAVCDAVVESSYNNGQPVKVDYTPVDNTI